MKGRLIVDRARDRYGEITVSEEHGRRSLFAGRRTLQSMMYIDRPSFPAMDYSQAMMSALLFQRNPRTVLLIGLGGGTLVNFLLETCPAARIRAVEISRAVIAAARRHFGLPGIHPRLEVIEADGVDLAGKLAREGARYDLLVVDAFDEDGVAAPLRERSFMEACRELLDSRGVFVVNLWDRPQDGFPGVFAVLGDVFDAALKLPLGENYCNVVAFGFRDPSAARNLRRLRPAARRLGAETGINFSKFLRAMDWQNA